jgi:hypothetical protein
MTTSVSNNTSLWENIVFGLEMMSKLQGFHYQKETRIDTLLIEQKKTKTFLFNTVCTVEQKMRAHINEHVLTN